MQCRSDTVLTRRQLDIITNTAWDPGVQLRYFPEYTVALKHMVEARMDVCPPVPSKGLQNRCAKRGQMGRTEKGIIWFLRVRHGNLHTSSVPQMKWAGHHMGALQVHITAPTRYHDVAWHRRYRCLTKWQGAAADPKQLRTGHFWTSLSASSQQRNCRGPWQSGVKREQRRRAQISAIHTFAKVARDQLR
jgi:hypothetical protein